MELGPRASRRAAGASAGLSGPAAPRPRVVERLGGVGAGFRPVPGGALASAGSGVVGTVQSWRVPLGQFGRVADRVRGGVLAVPGQARQVFGNRTLTTTRLGGVGLGPRVRSMPSQRGPVPRHERVATADQQADQPGPAASVAAWTASRGSCFGSGSASARQRARGATASSRASAASGTVRFRNAVAPGAGPWRRQQALRAWPAAPRSHVWSAANSSARSSAGT